MVPGEFELCFHNPSTFIFSQPASGGDHLEALLKGALKISSCPSALYVTCTSLKLNKASWAKKKVTVMLQITYRYKIFYLPVSKKKKKERKRPSKFGVLPRKKQALRAFQVSGFGIKLS